MVIEVEIESMAVNTMSTCAFIPLAAQSKIISSLSFTVLTITGSCLPTSSKYQVIVSPSLTGPLALEMKKFESFSGLMIALKTSLIGFKILSFTFTSMFTLVFFCCLFLFVVCRLLQLPLTFVLASLWYSFVKVINAKLYQPLLLVIYTTCTKKPECFSTSRFKNNINSGLPYPRPLIRCLIHFISLFYIKGHVKCIYIGKRPIASVYTRRVAVS